MAEKENMTSDYKFYDPENTACFMCDHVMTRQRPILYAAHFASDFYWQFSCGQNGHADEDIKIISLKEATQIDSSINDLYEMPLGVGAERNQLTTNGNPLN